MALNVIVEQTIIKPKVLLTVLVVFRRLTGNFGPQGPATTPEFHRE
ncbi:MAG: hypothetical protein AVDCRST_MAG96-820 [uncultured Segetibacter sp.]|uniref:Uncharacterized protein n=1 Tax=uncultured Segetibacter sp. TaxID=481133 RepID=A0A6J4RN71_9BACT|nr:MAG: hypothetical protein AVDCRST_MAG96-820 [uncultured Segetibacter sp.]